VRLSERRFEGTLTAADSKRHLEHPFEVASGATRLEFKLTFEPELVAGIGNMLTLSLFDPAGSRGAGHRGGANHLVVITTGDATPGYTPGPIPPGLWLAVVDTHLIMPGPPCRYELEAAAFAELGAEPATKPAPVAASRPGRGPGWYRGDLHGHSVHSDGAWDVGDLVASARFYGLDFVTLSDHNTVSGLAQIDQLGADDILTMGGAELTTFWGHALALGGRDWVDWRVRPGRRTMPQIAAEVIAADGLFIIAHPKSPGDPQCTGCDWRYTDMMPGNAPVVEVWNGPWSGASNNEQALALWYSWLEEGLRVRASAGTDIHQPAPPSERLGFNVVYAAELGEPAILDAVARGHNFLSSGPRLELTAQTLKGSTAMMGDVLPIEESEVTVAWSASVGDRLRLVVDGRPGDEVTLEPVGKRSWHFGPRMARSCLVELRSAGGELLALTNPIFWG